MIKNNKMGIQFSWTPHEYIYSVNIWYDTIIKKIVVLLDVYFSIINPYQHFLWSFYGGLIIYDWSVVKNPCSLDHVCLRYRFRSLISSYLRFFSCSSIYDPMSMKFLLQLKNIIIGQPQKCHHNWTTKNVDIN